LPWPLQVGFGLQPVVGSMSNNVVALVEFGLLVTAVAVGS